MIPFPGELESTTDQGNWYELHYSDTIPGTVLQPDPRSAAPYCNDYAGTLSTLSEGMLIRCFPLLLALETLPGPDRRHENKNAKSHLLNLQFVCVQDVWKRFAVFRTDSVNAPTHVSTHVLTDLTIL